MHFRDLLNFGNPVFGPYDLSQSLGVPGQVDHPKVTETIYQAVQALRSKGLVAGTFVSSPEMTRKWIDAGVQFIGYSVDILIFAEAAERHLRELNNLKKE